MRDEEIEERGSLLSQSTPHLLCCVQKVSTQDLVGLGESCKS